MKTFMVVKNETESGIKVFGVMGKAKQFLADRGYQKFRMGMADGWFKRTADTEAEVSALTAAGFVAMPEVA